MNTKSPDNIAAARQTGRLTFFEIADLKSVKEATDLMLRVAWMSPLLEDQDVANWRKAYEAQEMDGIRKRDADRQADA